MAKKRSPQPRRRGSVLPGVAVAGVALLVVAYYGARTREAPPAAVQQAPSAYPVSAAQAPQIPTVNPEAIVAPDLPPLPLHLASATRPLSVVRAVYEFAARHPEVLQYVPCYCGCELDGHTANDNCFVASREGGRITWDAHGLTWNICLDVARDAMQMHTSGAPVTAIRAEVERRYGGGAYRTPTPEVPVAQ